MLHALLSGALTAIALFSGVMAADAPGEPIETSSAAVTVVSDRKTMSHFWTSASFGELRCPDHAPFLDTTLYSVGVPRGIEVRISGGNGVHVWSWPNYHSVQTGRPIGIAAATTTNWAVPEGSRDVQFVAHCVAN